MKTLSLIFLVFSLNTLANSECEQKVTKFYKAQYHRVYNKASQGHIWSPWKKAHAFHFLGTPQMAWALGTNVVFNKLAKIAKRHGKNDQFVVSYYQSLLNSGELCSANKDNWQDEKVLVKYLKAELRKFSLKSCF